MVDLPTIAIINRIHILSGAQLRDREVTPLVAVKE